MDEKFVQRGGIIVTVFIDGVPGSTVTIAKATIIIITTRDFPAVRWL